MNSLSNKRIVLGVSGGIAAYKSADLVRRLRERGCDVRVVMTTAARAFVTPLTFQAVSGNPVHSDLFDPAAEAAMGHIELARWADLVIIAPATADCLAKLAHGLADELLSTLCLATTARIAVAPAMNQGMWDAAATQANMAVLAHRRVAVLGPGEGSQACGDVGPGRMLEPDDIVEALTGLFQTGSLADLSVLITAGPTREAIDPVRYISNCSSGKMGYAIARAAAEVGAKTTLISGPTALQPPEGVERVSVDSAAEMHSETVKRAAASDIFIAAAAVADYRPARSARSKIKKTARTMGLELERTADILSEVAGLSGGPFTVGFAAETDEVERNALKKLKDKSLDMIAANRVGAPGSGFESDENALSVFWPGGRMELALASKSQIARQLIEIVAERYHEKKSSTQDSRRAAR